MEQAEVSHFMDPRFAAIESRTCKCSHHCWKLTSEIKTRVFDNFNQMNTHDQNLFLVKCIQLSEPKRRKVPETVSRRQVTFTYNIEGIIVCLKTLCDVTDVTARRIQMLQKKMKQGKTDFSDLRGRHNKKSNRVSDEVKDMIRLYIQNFPRLVSPYTGVEYFSSNLNVKKMLDLFRDKNPTINVPEFAFNHIFEKEFGIQFGVPRSSACAKCDTTFVKLCSERNPEHFKSLSVENALHHKKTNKAYRSLNKDFVDAKRNNHDVHILCGDLQELSCPTINDPASLCYQRLTVYNYAIRNIVTDKATMNIWHEGSASCGTEEIASIIFRYIIQNWKPLPSLLRNRRLVIWTDRCLEQNRSWTMVALFHYLVSLRYFTQIDQKFVPGGHSFLPCDNDFAMINQNKNGVCIPSDWGNNIVNARPDKSLSVQCLGPLDFSSLASVKERIAENPELNFDDIVWLRYDASDPYFLRFRTDFNILSPWSVHSLRKIGVKSEPVQISPENLPSLHTEPKPISLQKKNDLKMLCELLPPQDTYKKFYQSLCSE